MYHYLYIGYIAYKAYEYSNAIEHIVTVGDRVRRAYNWWYKYKPVDERYDGVDEDWLEVDKDVI